MDAEEQYQQRRHQRATTHTGQTDESADNKTGEWIEPVHDRYTSALESGLRSFRSIACLPEIIGAFLRAERGHQRAGNAASFVVLAATGARRHPSCSLGAVLDHHERSEFGRMQASRRPNQR